MITGLPAGFDFTDPLLWEKRRPAEEFAFIRRTAPVWWNAQTPQQCAPFDDGGYWVISRHEDIREVSRHPELYSSNRQGSIIARRAEDVTDADFAEAAKDVLLINMDPPKHTELRHVISRGFTPRAIEGLRAALTERAAQIVHAADRNGSGDFVAEVACELPLQAIAELLGVPQEDRHKLFSWSNDLLNQTRDPEYGDPAVAGAEVMAYGMTLAEQRRAEPLDDIVSRLVGADVDGRPLTTDEFGFFVILLTVAGNETTRNAITHGMKAFVDNPEQWELFRARRPGTAPDEIVRWASPVTVFQRTATADTELGGQPIRAGQRLGLFYGSANFDEAVFTDPFTFDILRDPNPHLGFGGTGAHYCIGASLARLEIELIFDAIADTMPGLRQLAEPQRLRSGWINGIKHWQVAYR